MAGTREDGDRVIGQNPWLDFGKRIRGVRIQLYDRKQVFFKMLNLRGSWETSYPMLIPRPDDETAPHGEIDDLINSEYVILLLLPICHKKRSLYSAVYCPNDLIIRFVAIVHRLCTFH